jgi:hypothetical protein
MTLTVSHLARAREEARNLFCVQNLRQLTQGMNLYRLDYFRYPNTPLDDFRPLLPYVHNLDAYVCPSTTNEIKDIEDLNWGTSYRYFGTRHDLASRGMCALGRCCNDDEHYAHAFDPAHPGKSWPWHYRYGAVFDRSYENHDSGCLNIVFLDDNHWQRICSSYSCFDRSLDGTDPGNVDSTETDPVESSTAIDEHLHVHVHSRGDASISCTFTARTIHVTSTKDLSNVVLEFLDGTRQKFDGLAGLEGLFLGTGENIGKQIVGCWVKSGRNASGDGPGYGAYFPTTFLAG